MNPNALVFLDESSRAVRVPDEFRQLGLLTGHSAEEVRALAAALGATIPVKQDEPSVVRDARMTAAAAVLYETNWEDAAVCVRAQMSPAEAKDFLLSGADIEPIRLLAGLTG